MSAGDEAQWLSISEYAKVYGIDRSTVYKWLRNGVLTTYAVDRCRRIRNLPPDLHKKSDAPLSPDVESGT